MDIKKKQNLRLVIIYFLVPVLLAASYILLHTDVRSTLTGVRSTLNRIFVKKPKYTGSEYYKPQVTTNHEKDDVAEKTKARERERRKRSLLNAQNASFQKRVKNDIKISCPGGEVLVEIYLKQVAINIITDCSIEDAGVYALNAVVLAKSVVGEDYTVMCVVKNNLRRLAGVTLDANSNTLRWE